MADSFSQLDALQQAADALKQGIVERNDAGLALARAKTKVERRIAAVRHANACKRLEALKRGLVDLAAGRIRRADESANTR
ncbi:MAG TPA: hypothetical protein VKN99_20400 [Polyangia bacterium]|nr:hypothetical protein [Polyangia bacterium]